MATGLRSGRSIIVRGFVVGLAIHLFAAAVYGALTRSRPDGCDAGDGSAGALGLAVVADLVLLVLAVITRIRSDRPLWAIWVAGLGASLIVGVAMFAAAAGHVAASGSGCPV